jgi:cellulose synthase/poly-beta-1,6-N-acetylglucosamine synthase-like glycosyltransferase
MSKQLLKVNGGHKSGPQRTNRRNAFWVGIFFLLASVWGLMIYFTIVPWALGYALPVNSKIDISLITWSFVIFSLASSSLWFFMQIGFILIGNKMTRNQQKLISMTKNSVYHPLVSIIIPARNEEAVIRRTISSALAQSYTNVEVLVICHNCTDNTYSVASKIADKRVRAFDFRTEQAGKGIALDYGANNSNGKYLLVLDSDGILKKDFIETALPLFDRPNVAAVQGKLLSSNRNYNTITKLLALEGDLFSIPFMTVKSLLDRRTPLGGTGYIVRNDILQSVGGFGNALIDDFELSFRLFRNKFRIQFAPLSIEYDEKPPELPLMMRQRSRWVKGHMDLLRHRVAETTDIVGNIYWLNPVLMIGGFAAMCIVAFGLMNYLTFGHVPYKFSFVPIKIWIVMTVAGYFLQLAVLIKQDGWKGFKKAGSLALMPAFSVYWYAVLIKAFFVKSWASTKTTHGFHHDREIALLKSS